MNDSFLSGVVKLVALLLITWLVCAIAGILRAESVTLAWDDNPASEGVVRYDVTVVEVFGMNRASYSVTTPRATITDLTPSGAYLFSVVAVGPGGLVSEPAELGHTMSAPQVKRTIQYSTDLINWTDIQTFTGPCPKAEFLRFKIVTP